LVAAVRQTRRNATVLTDQVEAEFYRLYAPQLSGIARVAALLRAECRGDDGERYLLLEDLDAAGYPRRVSHISSGEKHLHACLLWLARLHATFLTRAGLPPPGLWETGCYWHLATRADELAAMPDGPLKSAAAAIDERLSQAAWTTVVHGDAKLANFCFAARGSSADDEGGVAAVDFQYAGGGCGVRDVAYLLGSGLGEGELERAAPRLLGEYFRALRAAAAPRATAAQLDEMEAEWRGLWDWAVADFQRFLAGWAPGHWKMNGYSARVAAAVARRCRKG
jgi:aminoglycoside phosphotransferase (APT) family kinase protein